MVENDQRYVQLDTGVDVLVCAVRPESGIGADEVDSERTTSQGAQSVYHHDQAGCGIAGCSQHTQSTGIGDGGRKLVVRAEAHTCSSEWMLDAVIPGQAGLRGGDVRISGRVGHGFSFDMLRFGVSSI